MGEYIRVPYICSLLASPFTAVTKDGTTRNVTDAAGVRFVGCPPRIMQSEPQRENYKDKDKEEEEEEENEGEQPQGSGGKKSVDATIKSIQGLLTKRQDKSERLPEKAVTHWNALKAAFGAGARPGALPDMPVTYSGVTFKGCPMKFLPILKEMRRFPRPFICWDPFEDEPPSSWPDAAAARAANQARGAQHDDSGEFARPEGSEGEGGLRDPRQHNHVTGLHYTKADKASALRQVTEEDWVADFADVAGKNRKEPIKEGLLYLMQLSVPEGSFKLGFAQAGKARIFALDEGAQHQAKWFVKTGEMTTWSETPTFIPYMVEQKRSVEYVPSESFLMEVDDRWLTEGTVAAKHTEGFRITKDFMKRLRRLKDEYPKEFGDDGAPAAPQAQAAAPEPGFVPGTHGKRQAEGGTAGADPAQRPKRPSLGAPPLVQPAEGLAIVVQDLEARLPGARVTMEVGSAVNDKELKDHVKCLIDTGLKRCGINVSSADMRTKLSGLKSKKWIVAREEANGRSSVLGFIAYNKTEHSGNSVGYIHELHVRQDLQGKGVGGALMKAAEADLQSMGLGLSYLTVHVANARARALYARLGYQTEHIPEEIKESCGFECLELCKALQ